MLKVVQNFKQVYRAHLKSSRIYNKVSFGGLKLASMWYSSSLSDEEWKICESLLLQTVLEKKQTRLLAWVKREVMDDIFYQRKKRCNWEDFLKDLPPCHDARSLALRSDAGAA